MPHLQNRYPLIRLRPQILIFCHSAASPESPKHFPDSYSLPASCFPNQYRIRSGSRSLRTSSGDLTPLSATYRAPQVSLSETGGISDSTEKIFQIPVVDADDPGSRTDRGTDFFLVMGLYGGPQARGSSQMSRYLMIVSVSRIAQMRRTASAPMHLA